MPILLDNKLLQATEQQLESSLLPETKSDYMRIVVSGMKVAMADGPNGMLSRLKTSRNPINDCAIGAIHLVLTMSKGSRGVMPTKALIPAAYTLMLQALDFTDKAGIAKVGRDELVKATHVFMNKIYSTYGITMPMLNKAAGQVHGIMSDPTKMEMINRRVGAVKDPRAGTPTIPGATNGV